MHYRAAMDEVTTVDVYEMASGIGNQFQKLIELFGREKLTIVMTMVLKALEHLEEQTIKLENENAEMNDLRFTIERLQEERKMKAHERDKFTKECELLDDSLRVELQLKVQKMEELQEEVRKLKTSLTQSNNSFTNEDVSEEYEELVKEVGGMRVDVGRFRGLWRDAVKKAEGLTCECEMLERDKCYLEGHREELRRRLREVEGRVQEVMVERDSVDGKLREKEMEVRVCMDRVAALERELDVEERDMTISDLQQQVDRLQSKLNQMEGEQASSTTSGIVHDFDEDDSEDDDDVRAVQGPINREPEEKLYPHKFAKKSKIRTFFKRLINPPSQQKSSTKIHSYHQANLFLQHKCSSQQQQHDQNRFQPKLNVPKKQQIFSQKSQKLQSQHNYSQLSIQQQNHVFQQQTQPQLKFSHQQPLQQPTNNYQLTLNQQQNLFEITQPEIHSQQPQQSEVTSQHPKQNNHLQPPNNELTLLPYSNFSPSNHQSQQPSNHQLHPPNNQLHSSNHQPFLSNLQSSPSNHFSSDHSHSSHLSHSSPNPSISPTELLLQQISLMDDPSHLNNPLSLHSLLLAHPPQSQSN